MKRNFRSREGFTLIEILVVVILLGILATIIIPQISVSTEDAKLNTLKTNLNHLRSAVELYYYQHNNTYPGATKHTDGTSVGSDAEAVAAFIPQLTQYSSLTGEVATSGSSIYQFGPYIKSATLPANPFNNASEIACDYDETDITARDSSGSNTGYKFYPQTGVLISGDNGQHNDL
jgi:prepilin-type N-terminal cleavage/methylation domain-containing protein